MALMSRETAASMKITDEMTGIIMTVNPGGEMFARLFMESGVRMRNNAVLAAQMLRRGYGAVAIVPEDGWTNYKTNSFYLFDPCPNRAEIQVGARVAIGNVGCDKVELGRFRIVRIIHISRSVLTQSKAYHFAQEVPPFDMWRGG